MANIPVSTYLLIKLSSRCNLSCTYCYWFRDSTVYETPKLLLSNVENLLVEKLKIHIEKHELKSFNCIFHGGEPMLFGIDRFTSLLNKLNEISSLTGCQIEYSITTNGVLINDEWAALFMKNSVRVAISIDGKNTVHDKYRKTLNGKDSHSQVIRGYNILVETGINPSIIAVCDPLSDAAETLNFFVDDLHCNSFDILPPDLNYSNEIIPISKYYIALFDSWYDNYFDKGVKVRFLVSLIRSVLGLETDTDSFGYGPLHTISLNTNGALEPNDVLRIGGNERTKTTANIETDSLDDVCSEPNWQEAYNSALKLCAQCESCKYNFACGGGHLSHRWSVENGYDNPSVYCEDLKQIFDHVWTRVSNDIFISQTTGDILLSDYLKTV